MPVGLKSLDGDKEITGLCLAGIIADAADLKRGIGGAFQYFDMFEKLRKLHGVFLRQYLPKISSSLSMSVTSTTVPCSSSVPVGKLWLLTVWCFESVMLLCVVR